jgi:hypothetical protein
MERSTPPTSDWSSVPGDRVGERLMPVADVGPESVCRKSGRWGSRLMVIQGDGRILGLELLHPGPRCKAVEYSA